MLNKRVMTEVHERS